MSINLIKVIYALIIIITWSCQNRQELNGNYFICHDGYYREIYFKVDSIRAAADNEWIKLSKWQKIKLKHDTLHFVTFGEWSDSSKALLKYIDEDKIALRNLKSGDTMYLEPINESISFEDLDKFWNGFYKRQKSENCK